MKSFSGSNYISYAGNYDDLDISHRLKLDRVTIELFTKIAHGTQLLTVFTKRLHPRSLIEF